VVSKADQRIEAYGTVDELNACVGTLRDTLGQAKETNFHELIAGLKQVQNELFDIGGELSTPPEVLNPDLQQVVKQPQVERLEKEIDAMNALLPPLENFVLPGGNLANSAAHLARTVCRRAEREVVRLATDTAVRPEVLVFLNRLSDWLFVVGRKISQDLGSAEILWKQNKKKG